MARFPAPSPWMISTLLLAGAMVGIAVDRAVPKLVAGKRVENEQEAGKDDTRRVNFAAVGGPKTPRGADESVLYQELDRQYQQFDQVNRTFELVAKAVSPAVVHIVTHKTTRHGQRNLQFEETGSGVIVKPGGKDGTEFVLTNNHVIDKAAANEIQIFLHDGRVLRPDRVWNDAKSDIGVLRLPVVGLPSARLGNSDNAVVGSWVLALGSPFGLTHSVSQGIVSARNRHQQELQDDGNDNQDFLQTDAAINPGNSGGPLVNMRGEVIGINTAIASNGGGSEGVGFSIPINLARWIMDQLVAKGRVRRGAIGVDLDDLTASQALVLGLDRPRGAQVRHVHAGSPAALSGLKKGDVVLRFNGAEILNLNHLINLVAMAPIGQPADVIVWRDEQEITRPVTIGELDRIAARLDRASVSDTTDRSAQAALVPQADLEAKLGLGLASMPIDPRSAKHLGLAEDAIGIVVVEVEPDGPLADSIQPRDLIYAVNGEWIRSFDKFAQIAAKRTAGKALDLWVERPSTGKSFQIRWP